MPRHGKGHLDGPNSPASPSPVTDGERVYAFFQDAGLTAFTVDGKELWHMPLGPFNMFYGFGASPILVDGIALLAVDQNIGSYLLGVDARTGKTRYKIDRPGVISGYSTPTVYQPKSGPKQILVPESFQLSAYSIEDGRRVWWVRGLACEMKSVPSIEGDVAYVNGWGFPQNQPGTQVPTVPFEEGLKLRHEQRRPDRADGDHRRRADGQDAQPEVGFPAFDLDRDGTLDAEGVGRVPRDARVGERPARDHARRSGRHDRERGEVALSAPGAAGALDAALPGRAVHGQRQRHPDRLRSGDGQRAQAGPAQRRDRQVLRLAGRRRRQGVAGSQDGTVSVVDAKGAWDILAVNALDDEVFATPAIADGRIYVRTKSTLYAFGSTDCRSSFNSEP